MDIASGEVHPAIRWFKHSMNWSDGEQKNRWVYIPECEQIVPRMIGLQWVLDSLKSLLLTERSRNEIHSASGSW